MFELFGLDFDWFFFLCIFSAFRLCVNISSLPIFFPTFFSSRGFYFFLWLRLIWVLLFVFAEKVSILVSEFVHD